MSNKVNDTLQWLREAEQKFRKLAYGDTRSPRPKIGLALAGGFARGLAGGYLIPLGRDPFQARFDMHWLPFAFTTLREP